MHTQADDIFSKDGGASFSLRHRQIDIHVSFAFYRYFSIIVVQVFDVSNSSLPDYKYQITKICHDIKKCACVSAKCREIGMLTNVICYVCITA